MDTAELSTFLSEMISGSGGQTPKSYVTMIISAILKWGCFYMRVYRGEQGEVITSDPQRAGKCLQVEAQSQNPSDLKLKKKTLNQTAQETKLEKSQVYIQMVSSIISFELTADPEHVRHSH